MATATLPRQRRSAPVAVAPADALDLTPAQRTALHQVYQLILSFAQPVDSTQRRRGAEEDEEKGHAATLCAAAPLRQKQPTARRQGGRS